MAFSKSTTFLIPQRTDLFKLIRENANYFEQILHFLTHISMQTTYAIHYQLVPQCSSASFNQNKGGE